MVKFGRKFFFDKVHTKKNYTLTIIIVAILLIAITATFLITSYYKDDKPKLVKPKVVFKEKLEIGIYDVLPNIDLYIKEIKNIDASELTISYPEELKIDEDLTECETEENTDKCKKLLAASIGEYRVTIKSKKSTPKENIITLVVVDKKAPSLELKEVTITEGSKYEVKDFIKSCSDNSKQDCIYEYYNGAIDKDGNPIDYSIYTKPGTYEIKIIAKDSSENISDALATKLIISKKAEEPKKEPSKNNSTTKDPEKPKTCKYGDLKYSDTFIIATKINDTECAISAEEAENLSNKAATAHNKKFIKELQTAYLQNTIDQMNLDGEITYDITFGPVFNTSNKGVVGYYLMSEANQTIDGVTTTIARYFIDESGNRVWKINALNLK